VVRRVTQVGRSGLPHLRFFIAIGSLVTGCTTLSTELAGAALAWACTSPRNASRQYELIPGVFRRMPVATESQTALGEIWPRGLLKGAPELYDRLDHDAVRCYACGHRCKILTD